jgi:hypothetical protein
VNACKLYSGNTWQHRQNKYSADALDNYALVGEPVILFGTRVLQLELMLYFFHQIDGAAEELKQ